MKKIYTITLPERIWHWLNAALFITLAATGMLMHASARLPALSLAALIEAHNLAALLFILNLIFWFSYQALSGRIRQYLRMEKDMVSRLVIQARFYAFGIFKGGPHPFPVTADSKFNPLQRVTYLGLMFGLVPLQVLTGAVLYGFSQRIEWLSNLPQFRMIALVHTATSYMLIAFLVGHLYLATTGETPLDLVKSMITGYHEHRESREG
jgi:thiosulfate reductase cytochrome b subunit